MGVFTCSTGIKPTVHRMNISRDQGNQCSGMVSSSFVITKPWRLRDHLRWVFRKNSMEFSVGFDYLLILLLQVAVLLLLHNHMSFQNILWSHNLIIWYDYLISHAIYILTPLYNLILEIKCLNAWKTLSFLKLL